MYIVCGLRSNICIHNYADSFCHVELSPFAYNWIHPLNEGNGEEGVSTNDDEDDLCLLSHKFLGIMITTLKGLTYIYIYNV